MTSLPFEDLPEPPAEMATELAMAFEIAFNGFWLAYPRKVGKRRARSAWAAASKRAGFHEILAGLERYKRNKPSYCDWMHPTTFLNGDHWEDEYGPFRQTNPTVWNGESLEIIAAHAKRPWCERGKYPRDVLEQCVEAGLLTREEAEAVL